MENDPARTWQVVENLVDLDEDEPLGAEVGDQMIALYLVDSEVYATTDVCTHEFAQLSGGFVEDSVVECPLHQARFDVRTGKCLGPPAEADLKTYPVRIEDGWVLIGLPKQ